MQHIEIDLYKHKNPIVNDAYDRMVAAMHLRSKKDGVKAFSVSGCEPAVGATTIAINMAVSFALSGRKTLLVDTDMRKDQSVKRLNQGLTKGLSEYLSEKAEFQEALCETNIPRLYYVACGGATDNPVELMCSRRFDDLLGIIENEWDFAVFDSPSVNASVDASILAAKTAGAVLVAEYNKTKRDGLKSALRELERAGANVMGVVLNRMDRDEYRRHLKGYGYYYKKK